MTNDKTKQILLFITFSVVLYVGLMNFNMVLGLVSNLIDLLLPIIMGTVIALVLSVPMKGMENLLIKVFNRHRERLNEKVLAVLSFVLTVLTIVLIVVVVGVAIVPKMVDSIQQVYGRLKDVWPTWSKILVDYGFEVNTDVNWSDTINIKGLYTEYKDTIGGLLSTVIGKTSSVISMMVTVFSALVITLHVSLTKKNLCRQIKKLMYANLKEEKVNKIIDIAKLVKETYTKFLSGQFIEAIILGILIFIALTIAGIEYSGLIAVLTSICAFVPYIGAFISCGVAVILTLLSSPQEALVCFIVYEVVQFIENQFIYPKVVGDYVGMSPLFTFLAVLFGGKLLGLVGILFFIPLTAVIYTLLKENTNKKLQERNISIN